MATTKITSPDLFDLASLNTALQLPNGTTAERPTSPSTGEWRYNTTTNLVEFWDGGEWRDLQSEDIPPIPSENFNTVLYTGNGSTQSITGVGFQPDFVWIKERGGVENHYWQDSSRGSTYQIYSNQTAAQFNETTAVTSFDSDGFTMGGYTGINNNGDTYVAWCWKANGGTITSNGEGTITSDVQVNTKAGFSMVKFTGTGANDTVGHGLGAAPEIIIFKNYGGISGWKMFTNQTPSPSTQVMELSDPSAYQTPTNPFNSTLPTSTVFSVGTYSDINSSGGTFIAYCFKSVAGYSKIGSYTGNASDAGPIINTVFEPAWLMIKVSDGSADSWFMVDNKRQTSNPRDERLFANSNVAEASEPGAKVDFFTNGFQIRGSGGGQGQVNASGSTYLYIAFASDASSAPSLSDSFNTSIYDGSGTTRSIGGVGFSPSLVWVKCRDATGQHSWFDTIRGPLNRLASDSTSSQSNVANTLISFDSDGFTFGNEAGNNNGETNVAWMWKASTLPAINTDGTDTSIVSANVAAGFSIAALPNKAGTQNLGHGLDGVPDLIIMKQYEGGTGGWTTYNSPIGVRNYMNLNSSNANTVATPGYEYDAVTATTITNLISGSTYSYIYYCWKNVAGFSKVGSYTGNGATQAITGLGFSPNWVMIKETDGVDSWEVYDTARGATKVLYPNGTNAEGVNTGLTSFDSDGFTMGSATSANESGKNYLYVAYAQNPAQPAVASGEMEYLVVAGGASGGSNGGGGGAGGLRTSYGNTSGGGASAETAITLAAGTYTITVGAGGASIDNATNYQDPGNAGSASTIAGGATVNTVGGGGGGSNNIAPSTGGSGGGSGSGTGGPTAAAGTANEGFAGGDGMAASHPYLGGGGGGAGSVGQAVDGSGPWPGGGGTGLMVAINALPTAYAGGGGGTGGTGSGYTAGGGAGGSGGGGNGGAYNGSGIAGLTNTGGGGGATGDAGSYTSGAGGSGVIILRLLTADYSGSTTGSPTVTTSGSETILTYTGSGTYVHS